MFLTPGELKQLTGYAQKAKQVEHLRRLGVPFYLNASGQPVVARAVIEGKAESAPKRKPWSPSWAANPQST